MADEWPTRRAKEPVSAFLAGPYGHPIHPMLVTVPIGAWTSSLVFDIASHVEDGDSDFLSRGAMWLIAVGLIGAVAAAMFGLLDLATLPTGTTVFRTGLAHLSLNTLAIGLYLVNFLWRHSGGGPSGPVDAGPLVLNIAGMVVLGGGGWLGGRLAYRYGVRVADETTQAEGYQAGSRPTATPDR
jgi:uncharacterized membrane protein